MDLRGMYLEELKELASKMGEPPYRGQQIFIWIHRRLALAVEEMTDLPLAFRDQLSSSHPLPPLKILESSTSALDNTLKLLLELPDGEKVECVLMEQGGRRTACLSSQAGCPLGCRFCATGQGGFRRNLTAGEMILQAVALLRKAREGDPKASLTNIVFMGMGEPLLNLEQVLRACRLFQHPKGWNISHRKITISTCGLVPQIIKLAEEKPPLELAVSLHATTDDIRSELMPINRQYPLKDVLEACRYYARATGRRVTFEYALIKGVNDSRKDARRLGRLLKGMLAFVNLIPLNPVSGIPYQGVGEEKAKTFARWLTQEGIEVAVRRSRGRDIEAACGQLRACRERGEKY